MPGPTSIVYRDSYPLLSITGKGSNLDTADFDMNNYYLLGLITALQDAPSGAGIDYFTVEGSNFYVTLTDHTVLGPYALPQIGIISGPWLPATFYTNTSITFLTVNGSVYLVTYPHTSAATFDPGANDGLGHNYYQFLFGLQAAPVVEVTTDTFTPDSSFIGSYIRLTNHSGCMVTIQDSITIPVGSEFHFEDACLGSAALYSMASPSELIGVSGYLNESGAMGGVVTIKKIATHQYKIFGLLAAHP